MWWTAMAYANTTTWQLTEAGTDLPVLAEVVCGEQVVQNQGFSHLFPI